MNERQIILNCLSWSRICYLLEKNVLRDEKCLCLIFLTGYEMVALNYSRTFYKTKLITYISEDLRVIIPRGRKMYYMISGNHLCKSIKNKCLAWRILFYSFKKNVIYLSFFIFSLFFSVKIQALEIAGIKPSGVNIVNLLLFVEDRSREI